MFILAALLGLSKLASAAGGNFVVDTLLDYQWAYPLDYCVNNPVPGSGTSYKYTCASDGLSVIKTTYSSTGCANTGTTSIIDTAGHFYCSGTNSYAVATVYVGSCDGAFASSIVPLATNVCVTADGGAVEALIDANSYVTGGFGEAQCSGLDLTVSAYNTGDSTCANTAYASSTVGNTCNFLFTYSGFNIYMKITDCCNAGTCTSSTGTSTTTTSTSSPYTTLAPFSTQPATDVYATITVTASVTFGAGYGWLVCKANYWFYALNSFLECSDIDIDLTVSGSGTNTCTDYNEGGTISVTATVRLTEAQYNAAVSYITDAYNKFPEEYKLAFRTYAAVSQSDAFDFTASVATGDFSFVCSNSACRARSSDVSRNMYGIATGLIAGAAIAAM